MAQRQTGFTLMELMVTVVIIAIIAALALPSFQSILEKRRLVGAAENLFGDLQYTRSVAIKQNQLVQFSFDAGSWCYGVDDDGANCDCTAPASCTVNSIQKVVNGSEYRNVEFAASGFAGTSFTFDPRQGLPSDTGTFTLTIHGQTKTVSVNAAGRVKMD